MERFNVLLNKCVKSGVLLAATLPLVLTGCQDEEFGYTADFFRNLNYEKNFKEVFGDVDPNHNWSMAQSVKVNINVPNAAGYQLRILTEAPTDRDAIILFGGPMQDDQLSVNVDVIRGKRNLYVELKSEFGIFLVDGYYNIDEQSVVEVNKMITRFAESAPTCNVYTQTIRRWKREWSDAMMASANPYQWDKGFFSYEDHLTHDNTNGWTLNGNTTKEISITNSKVIINGNEKSLNKCILFKNDGSPKSVSYSGLTGFAVSGMHFHIPLAVYNSGDSFTITLTETNGAEKFKKEEEVCSTTYTNTDGITFKDFSYWITDLDAKKQYTLTIQHNGNNNNMAVCGGLYLQTGWSNYTYSENVSGTVRYTDVRGGSMDINATSTLRNADTFRNGPGNQNFHYRTYDVTKMTGSSEGKGYMSTFYIINGDNGEDIKVGSEAIKYRDMFPLYGLYKSTKDGQWKGSPFREGDNHIDDYFTDGDYNPSTTYNMKHDAQVVTLGPINTGEVQYDGSVSIKMVGLGTNWANDIGYFYYPKDADVYRVINGERVLDFNKVPKIIIRKDMQGALNGQKPSDLLSGNNMSSGRLWISDYSRYVDGCYALSLSNDKQTELLSLAQFNNYQSDQFDVKKFIDGLKDNPTKKQQAADATFDAPIYKLVNYGWQTNQDGKYVPTGSPSYIWPKDYVIGFFGIRTDDMVAAELSRIYTSSASVQRNYFNDLPRGSAFSYKGKNYIGLEDEWDYDNNDFLFEIQGIQSVEPDITPEDDITTTKTIQNWIIACEDLGGVWDYDFNDLVWAVSKEVNTTTTVDWQGHKTDAGTTDIYFQPLAAGGTLHAVVQYNTSIVLNPSEDDPNWETLGEIHALVSRNQNAPTNKQINVKNNDPWQIWGKPEMIGERIKIGSTIPTTSSDITIESILSHFRIIVTHEDQSYIVKNVTPQKSADNDHADESNGQHNNTGNRGATNTPQFLLLPEGWAWPSESVCITEVYSLTDWVSNQNASNWLDTWKNSSKEGADYVINPLQ